MTLLSEIHEIEHNHQLLAVDRERAIIKLLNEHSEVPSWVKLAMREVPEDNFVAGLDVEETT